MNFFRNLIHIFRYCICWSQSWIFVITFDCHVRHSIQIWTVSYQCLLSALLNCSELVYGSIEPSNNHRTLDHCPGQSCRNRIMDGNSQEIFTSQGIEEDRIYSSGSSWNFEEREAIIFLVFQDLLAFLVLLSGYVIKNTNLWGKNSKMIKKFQFLGGILFSSIFFC